MQHEIITHVRQMTNFSHSYDRGWGNGYVGVPPGHPWHGVEYQDIDVHVHGGLTFSDNYKPGVLTPEPSEQGYWWIGFDTAHWGDDSTTCPEAYVREETDNLKLAAVMALSHKAAVEHIYVEPQ